MNQKKKNETEKVGKHTQSVRANIETNWLKPKDGKWNSITN